METAADDEEEDREEKEEGDEEEGIDESEFRENPYPLLLLMMFVLSSRRGETDWPGTIGRRETQQRR